MRNANPRERRRHFLVAATQISGLCPGRTSAFRGRPVWQVRVQRPSSRRPVCESGARASTAAGAPSRRGQRLRLSVSERALWDAGERRTGAVRSHHGGVSGVRALARTGWRLFSPGRRRRLGRRRPTLPLPARVGLSPPRAQNGPRTRPRRAFTCLGAGGAGVRRQASS